MLCLSQLIVSFTTIDSVVHNSQGRPHWVFNVSILYAVFIPVSVFISAHFGFNALVYPWLVIYPSLRMIFTYLTLKKLKLSILNYLNSILPPLGGSLMMILGIYLVRSVYELGGFFNGNVKAFLIQEIITGIILYSAYLLLFERKCIEEIWSLKTNEAVSDLK